MADPNRLHVLAEAIELVSHHTPAWDKRKRGVLSALKAAKNLELDALIDKHHACRGSDAACVGSVEVCGE